MSGIRQWTLAAKPGLTERVLERGAAFVVLSGACEGLQAQLFDGGEWFPIENGGSYHIEHGPLSIRWPSTGCSERLELLTYSEGLAFDARAPRATKYVQWPLAEPADSSSVAAGAWGLLFTLPPVSTWVLDGPADLSRLSLGGTVKRLTGAAGFTVACRQRERLDASGTAPMWRASAIQEQDWGLGLDGLPYPIFGGFLRVQPLTTATAFRFSLWASDLPPWRLS